LGRQMTESLSLRCERAFLQDLCALTDARRTVAAADCRHCLSHTHTHTTARGAGGSLCSRWNGPRSLLRRQTDHRFLRPPADLITHFFALWLRAAHLGRFPANSTTHHESFMRAAFSLCVCRTNNGNFPARAAVKMFTAARSFAVHWHCFYLFATLRCVWLYGILKLLSLCALVVGFALRFQCV
jgi:hypothetical protein